MTDKTIADVADHAIDKLSGGAAELARAAKSVAPHAWDVVVRQQVIEGTVRLLTLAVGAVAIVVLIKTCRAIAHSKDAQGNERGYLGEHDPSPAVPFWLGAVALSIFLAIRVFFYLPEDIARIANPEYTAAQSLIGAVK